MTTMTLTFSDQDMINFLHLLSIRHQYHVYDIDEQERTFIDEDNDDEQYTRKVHIVYYNGQEMTCSDEKNYRQKKDILSEEFRKRFKEHLLMKL